MIVFVVGEMNRATGFSRAGFRHRLMNSSAMKTLPAESRKEGRMNVEDPAPVAVRKAPQVEKSREKNEVGGVGVQRLCYRRAEGRGVRKVPSGDGDVRDACFGRVLQSSGVFHAAEDDSDALDLPDQVFKRSPRSRYEYRQSKALHRSILTPGKGQRNEACDFLNTGRFEGMATSL